MNTSQGLNIDKGKKPAIINQRKRELATPFKTLRVMALEKILKEGGDEETLLLLRDHEKKEDDPIARSLLERAINKLQKDLHKEVAVVQVEKTAVQNFSEQFRKAGASQRVEMLRQVTPAEVTTLAPQASELLQTETEPLVLFSLIRVIGDQWPGDRLADLLPHLLSPHPSIQEGVLAILVQKNPRMLSQYLPTFLQSGEPHIRALAIRGLMAVDLDEAVNHLDLLLQSADETAKRAAIKDCFFLPFDRAKPLLLKFFAGEPDPVLLDEAGLLFLSNPDQEVPVRLWEIAERSQPEKARLVKEVLSGACQALEKSGILREGLSAYLEKLQQWIYRRAAAGFVQKCLARLSTDDAGVVQETEAIIRAKLVQPLIKTAFEQALSWAIPEENKAAIRRLLGKTEVPPAVAEGMTLPNLPPDPQVENSAPSRASSPPEEKSVEAGRQPPSLAGLSDDEKIRRISSWPEESASRVKPLLEELFQTDPAPALRAAGLRAAGRLKIKDFVADAEKYLKSHTPNLATAAFEYLSLFDSEKAMLYLGQFLNSRDPWMKSVALENMQKQDPAQALASLAAMLQPKNVSQHAVALSCMIYFDFSLIRAILVEFSSTNPGLPLLEAGLCLFQTNPDVENLYLLFCLEKALPAECAGLVRGVRVEGKTFLEANPLLLGGRKIPPVQEWEERWQKDVAKKAAVPSPYSVKALSEGPFGKFDAGIKDFFREQLPAIFVILLGCVFCGLWFAMPSSQPVKLPPQAGAQPPVDKFIWGEVRDITREGFQVLGGDQAKYLLTVDPKTYPGIKVGSKLTCQVSIFRVLADGVRVANAKKIEIAP